VGGGFRTTGSADKKKEVLKRGAHIMQTVDHQLFPAARKGKVGKGGARWGHTQPDQLLRGWNPKGRAVGGEDGETVHGRKESAHKNKTG